MKNRNGIYAALFLLVGTMLAVNAAAQNGTSATANASPAVASAADARALRIEGEQRFRANCGRCHNAPHKFPPRMMATIVRHMRVRATITDDDMKLILRYMTE
ncbi:MAG TPA: cytochrome c [Candidatus Acidoferrum sp.]|nr:cytochrome c [Candidatus Acidoferrum sp.]